MKRIFIALTAAFLITAQAVFAAKPEGASGVKFRISPIIEDSILLGGDMGQITLGGDAWGPDVRDVFRDGMGGGFEFGYRFDSNWEVYFGSGYMVYRGGTVSVTNATKDRIIMSFSDMNAVPSYIGIKLLFSSQPNKGLVPYIKGDIGGIWLSDVDTRISMRPATDLFEENTVTTTWWKSSVRFMWDIGGGLEYRVSKYGVFFEAMSRGFTNPKSSGKRYIGEVLFNADGTAWMPLEMRLGASYYF